MGKALKVFGVICGIIAFLLCLSAGFSLIDGDGTEMPVVAIARFFIGFAFFAGPMLILCSLSSGVSASTKAAPSRSKPQFKSKPKAAAPASKQKTNAPDNKPALTGDVSIIYVGNLSPEANETVLRTAFSGYGEIKKIKIVKERSGRPKGFGFVEMYGSDAAESAIEAMNGEELAGRPLKVSKAKPKTQSRRPSTQPKPEYIEDEMRPNIFE